MENKYQLLFIIPDTTRVESTGVLNNHRTEQTDRQTGSPVEV